MDYLQATSDTNKMIGSTSFHNYLILTLKLRRNSMAITTLKSINYNKGNIHGKRMQCYFDVQVLLTPYVSPGLGQCSFFSIPSFFHGAIVNHYVTGYTA